eukprot:386386_1
MSVACVLLDAFYLNLFQLDSNFMTIYKHVITLFGIIGIILFLIWLSLVCYEIFVLKWDSFCFNMITPKHPKFVLTTSTDDFIKQCKDILNSNSSENQDDMLYNEKEEEKVQLMHDTGGVQNKYSQQNLNALELSDMDVLYIDDPEYTYGVLSKSALITIHSAIIIVFSYFANEANRNTVCAEVTGTISMCISIFMGINIAFGVMSMFLLRKQNRSILQYSQSHAQKIIMSFTFSMFSVLIIIYIHGFYLHKTISCSPQTEWILILALLLLGLAICSVLLDRYYYIAILFIVLSDLCVILWFLYLIHLMAFFVACMAIFFCVSSSCAYILFNKKLNKEHYRNRGYLIHLILMCIQSAIVLTFTNIANVETRSDICAVNGHQTTFVATIMMSTNMLFCLFGVVLIDDKDTWLNVRNSLKALMFTLFLSQIPIYFFMFHVYGNHPCKYDPLWLSLTAVNFVGAILCLSIYADYRDYDYDDDDEAWCGYIRSMFMFIGFLDSCAILSFLYYWNSVSFIIFLILAIFGCFFECVICEYNYKHKE